MATEPRNAYEFSGALGGLVAADRELRVRQADRLAAEATQIQNATAALELDLAQKYKRRDIENRLAQQQQALQAGEIQNEINQATIPSAIKGIRADATLKDIDAQTQLGMRQAEISYREAAGRQASAQARRLDAMTDPLVAKTRAEARNIQSQVGTAAANVALGYSRLSSDNYNRNEERKVEREKLAQREAEMHAQINRWNDLGDAEKQRADVAEEGNRINQELANIQRDKLRLEARQHRDDMLLAVTELTATAGAVTDTGLRKGPDGKKAATSSELDLMIGASVPQMARQAADMFIGTNMTTGLEFGRDKEEYLAEMGSTSEKHQQYVVRQAELAVQAYKNMFAKGRVAKLSPESISTMVYGLLLNTITKDEEDGGIKVHVPDGEQISMDTDFRIRMSVGTPSKEFIMSMANEYAKKKMQMPTDLALYAAIAAGGNVYKVPGMGAPVVYNQGDMVEPETTMPQFQSAFPQERKISP